MMRVILEIEKVFLNLAIVNGDSEIKIWDLNNSWGWYNVSFLVKTESGDDSFKIIRKDRDWTANIPTVITIKPREQYTIKINLKDGWWHTPHNVAAFANKMLIQGLFEIPLTENASKQSVFIGRMESAWIKSEPPHRWLN